MYRFLGRKDCIFSSPFSARIIQEVIISPSHPTPFIPFTNTASLRPDYILELLFDTIKFTPFHDDIRGRDDDLSNCSWECVFFRKDTRTLQFCYQLFPFILFYSRKLNYLCKFKGNFGIFPLLSIVYSYFQMMGMFFRLDKDISIPIIPCPVDDSFFLTFLFKTSEIGSWTIESFTCNYPTPWLVV